MSTTVQEVVTEELRKARLESYQRQAAPIIEALAEREYTATERLVQFATGQGLSRQVAVAAVQEAGLAVRPAPVAAPVADSSQIDRWQDAINQMQAEIDALRRR